MLKLTKLWKKWSLVSKKQIEDQAIKDTCSPSTDKTISFGQLGEFLPTQIRNLIKCFAKDLYGWKSGASDRTLEKMLVEFGSGDVMACRQASPTVLITRRDGYERKVNDKYLFNPTTIIPSVANGVVS